MSLTKQPAFTATPYTRTKGRGSTRTSRTVRNPDLIETLPEPTSEPYRRGSDDPGNPYYQPTMPIPAGCTTPRRTEKRYGRTTVRKKP